MTEHELTPFRRGLSDEFVAWLSSGLGRRLLDLLVEHGLDVRLRNDYFNAYQAQCSLSKVEWRPRASTARLVVDRAYLEGSELLAFADRDKRPSFDVSDEFLELYARELRRIRKTVSQQYASPEGRWEERCVRANLEGTPFLVIDRQIQNARPPLRLDLLAVSADPQAPLLLAVEFKRGLDNRIQHVPRQLARYLRMLDPTGHGLGEDVADSYHRVCTQLRSLGFAAPGPALVQPGMPVAGLVALANYNLKSKLLGRALVAAGRVDRPICFCFLTARQLEIPPEREWFEAHVTSSAQ